MCDCISLPDGREIESLNPKTRECLCVNTQKEIFWFIINNTRALQFSETLHIHYSPGFGYEVTITDEHINS